MSATFASAQHYHADGCHQNDDANDLKWQVVICEKQKTDLMDVVRCRSCEWRESLVRDTQSADDGKNLNNKRQRDRDATGGGDPINISKFFRAQIEQHDDEKKKHHDGAGIDEDLNDPNEVSVERDEERGQRQKRNNQAKRARDRIAVNDNGGAEDQHQQSGGPKEKRRHFSGHR